jgi:TIR domain-containing protein
MAGNIFINYRRDDDAGFTQALYSRLEQVFPSESLFMDVDNIAPGLDFVQVLNEEVARCDVVIAVIGKNWLGATDETGERRLDNPEDFVRIEIESALAQKKRVIPVLVNDAKMPRSTELPESLKAFARCNAVRLTHERFRADTAGLIKSLEQVLEEAEAARQLEDDVARRDAKAREKAEAERLRQARSEARKRRETKPESPRGETKRREPSSGVGGWIAGLPSEINWHIPIALAAIVLLGWILPARAFMPSDQGGLGWGAIALLYGLAGLLAIGVVFNARRSAMGGPELALYWFALVCFSNAVVLSFATAEVGQSLGFLPMGVLAIAAAVALIAMRRREIGGLEFAVYWFGLTLVLYAAGIALVTSTFFRITELGAFFEVRPRRAPGILLLSAIGSGLAILAWRNRRLSRPELALYLLGIAYWLSVWIRLVLE